ncbi:YhdP family protein [Psychromonas sp.]|uniref:YhdP family protein n=1 Tax=Psychromonas sp. TaxID=1884585 RepID=UPI003568E1D6
MKHSIFKWLRRFYALIAVKLFILAVLLTVVRILFVQIDDYKSYATQWLAEEYNLNLAFRDVSAGIDFSGLMLNVSDVELIDAVEIPYRLKLDHLFIYLNFWQSITEQALVFNRISVQGADITVKSPRENTHNSETSSITLASLQKLLLVQLSKVGVKDSQVHFKDHLGRNKTIVIEKLNWVNEEGRHQGTGYASIPNSIDNSSLDFVVDLVEQNENPTALLLGKLYVEAENFNIAPYLNERVNKNAQLFDAVLGFKAWAEFSSNSLRALQLQLNNTRLNWVQLGQTHRWQINSGLLQFTNSGNAWLLDSYDLDITHNQKKWQGFNISAHGDPAHAYFEFDEVNVKELMPFYLLHSDLTEDKMESLLAVDIQAQIDDLTLLKDSADEVHFTAHLSEFNNRPHGAIPGISNAQIEVVGAKPKGQLNITLPEQNIYFDGQFSREMPVQSAQLDLRWLQLENGLKLFSEQSTFNTRDLNTTTEFSLFFPNQHAQNTSPFLSLYTYADLNDAGNAQYYFPIKAMGKNVFNYLQPTLKKGQVKGAKILWYGALNQYPYQGNNGIFQAWVPLRESQYDFYGNWQGLTNLDLDLLFENDRLTMNAHKASLGDVDVAGLNAGIDHLNRKGILTINADISDDAQKISDYLKASPLKNSIGKALSVIEVQKQLQGELQLTIPFEREKQNTETRGRVKLANNNINLHLAENILLPLKDVQGEFSFINGNLIANNLDAQLLEQKVQISFNSKEQQERYQVTANVAGDWSLDKLKNGQNWLNPLPISGPLDWTAKVNFTHLLSGGYQYNVAFNSTTRGITVALPLPLEKNALQSWPTEIVVSGDENNTAVVGTIKNKLWLRGGFDYQQKQKSTPYFQLNIGKDSPSVSNKNKQSVNLSLDRLDITRWYQQWQRYSQQRDSLKTNKTTDSESRGLVALDEINIAVKKVRLFSQPINNLAISAVNDGKKWDATVNSNKLQGSLQVYDGEPIRVDADISKLNFQSMNLSRINAHQTAEQEISSAKRNLLKEYPEILLSCLECIYGDMNFSPLHAHIFPSANNLNINYLKIGDEQELTEISGVWDQKKTNLIVKSVGNGNLDIVKRLGYSSPVIHSESELSGAVNWIGAPWLFNLASLNGSFSATLTDGAITEVNDNGARLLSIFSLDGIRRTLNNEFNNVFSKGFNFDLLKFSGDITDGIVKNDDFYLNGSAGKISGRGLIDLPNYDTNYRLSYSPAVTSSLPVLTAFVISPLSGAAVYMLSKLLEPVVETIVRVDFSVKGALNNPEVKLTNRLKGKIKLQNSAVLEQMKGLNSENGSE